MTTGGLGYLFSQYAESLDQSSYQSLARQSIHSISRTRRSALLHTAFPCLNLKRSERSVLVAIPFQARCGCQCKHQSASMTTCSVVQECYPTNARDGRSRLAHPLDLLPAASRRAEWPPVGLAPQAHRTTPYDVVALLASLGARPQFPLSPVPIRAICAISDFTTARECDRPIRR